MTVNAAPLGRIMVVDDTPANLRLLEGMLRKQRYEVRSFPLGRLALAAAENDPPELILLDINMPEMTGYEVCERLKADPSLADIPVIFISALDATEDKVKGFHVGGADYVCKPFQFEEVQARVETHLRLRRAQLSERELLEKTLSGAIGSLLNLLQMTSPMLVVRSNSIREIVRWISRKFESEDAWQYELAGMLCLVGCIVLPDEVFEKAYGDQELKAEEDEAFRGHPAAAANILSSIPRLGKVAEIVLRQNINPAARASDDCIGRGAEILRLAMELDRKIYQNVDCHAAITQLRRVRRFDPALLESLEGYSPVRAEHEIRQLTVRELQPGMILDEDVFSPATRTLILKEDVELSPVWIERLRNFARSNGVQERVRVRIPRVPSPIEVADSLVVPSFARL